MSDFITWITDVMYISLSLGGVTVSLGSLVLSFVVIRFAVTFIKSLMGRR